jgi:GTPase SAR1 family protein
MGILLVYDVTDESSFNSKFSYCLTFSLQILRNLNSLPILLLFYCQHVLLAFSVFCVGNQHTCFLLDICSVYVLHVFVCG